MAEEPTPGAEPGTREPTREPDDDLKTEWRGLHETLKTTAAEFQRWECFRELQETQDIIDAGRKRLDAIGKELLFADGNDTKRLQAEAHAIDGLERFIAGRGVAAYTAAVERMVAFRNANAIFADTYEREARELERAGGAE